MKRKSSKPVKQDNLWKYSAAVSESVSDDYPSLLRGNFPDTIVRAEEIGFHAVEIHTGDPACFPVEEVLDVCRKRNMEISAVSSGISYSLEKLSVISEDEEIRLKARKRFIEYIDLSSKLDCMLIFGLMRGQISETMDYEKSESALEEYLHGILDYAAEKNVIIVCEAINRFQNNFMKSVEEVVDFVRKIRHPNFKAHLDTFHMNIEEQDCISPVYYAGNDLGYIHFSDSNRKIPGFGHIDFYSIARALKRTSYRNYITVECLPYPSEDTAAEMSLAYLKQMENYV